VSKKNSNRDLLNKVALRAHYLATQMISQANHRSDKQKGDPKIGGHPAACASALHIMGALHLVAKTGFDHIANKPHASPVDHSYNYLLNLFLKPDLNRLSQDEMNEAMMGLRKYSKNGEYVFQSYHSAYDCDNHNFFPLVPWAFHQLMQVILRLLTDMQKIMDIMFLKLIFGL
jgi:pyruvate dehydrogenase E1 component